MMGAIRSNYQMPFILALLLHMLLGGFLAWEPSVSNPVMVNEAENDTQNELGEDRQLAKQPDIVKAIVVDESAVKAQVEQIKQAREQAAKQEQARQEALQKAAEAARQARVNEQKHLEALKAEAESIAIAKRKALEEEKKHLKQLAEQKAKEEKALAELQKKQLQLKQQQAVAKTQAEAKAKADAESLKKAQQAAASAAEKAARDAQMRARLSGEVDKYKAQILQAISRQWILPEHLSPGLSSQFRIRLAPNGAVLEVGLIHSSGDPILDRSAQTAIYKASPLPVPSDPQTFDLFRDISLTVRPENVRT